MKPKLPNPAFSKYSPSFIHFYKDVKGFKKYTICIKTTKNIRVKVSTNKFESFEKIFKGNLVYGGNLCIFEQLIIDPQQSLRIELINNSNQPINIFESKNNYEYLDPNVNFINSNFEYITFNRNTLRRNKDEKFLPKLYNAIFIRLKYINMVLKNFFNSFIFTIKNIIVFLKTSRPK